MDINVFVQQFAGQFEDTDITLFLPETQYKSLEEWSSLMALTIIAMVDEEYDVKVKGDDIRESSTIKELFEIVKSRK